MKDRVFGTPGGRNPHGGERKRVKVREDENRSRSKEIHKGKLTPESALYEEEMITLVGSSYYYYERLYSGTIKAPDQTGGKKRSPLKHKRDKPYIRDPIESELKRTGREYHS